MNWRTVRLMVLAGLSIFGITVLAYVVAAICRPSFYEARCVVKRENDYPAESAYDDNSTWDKYFVAFQRSRIMSTDVLYRVIETLHLQERNAVTFSTAYRQLSDQVLVGRFANTALIEIVVRDQDRNRAVEIANADGKDEGGAYASCSSMNVTNAICPMWQCFSLVGKIQ
jgi:capsular polysaccharide biosynthesis protein